MSRVHLPRSVVIHEAEETSQDVHDGEARRFESVYRVLTRDTRPFRRHPTTAYAVSVMDRRNGTGLAELMGWNGLYRAGMTRNELRMGCYGLPDGPPEGQVSEVNCRVWTIVDRISPGTFAGPILCTLSIHVSLPDCDTRLLRGRAGRM